MHKLEYLSANSLCELRVSICRYIFMNTDMNMYLIFRNCIGMLIIYCKKNYNLSAVSFVLGKFARHWCLQTTFLVYLYIYMLCRTFFSAQASNYVLVKHFKKNTLL